MECVGYVATVSYVEISVVISEQLTEKVVLFNSEGEEVLRQTFGQNVICTKDAYYMFLPKEGIEVLNGVVWTGEIGRYSYLGCHCGIAERLAMTMYFPISISGAKITSKTPAFCIFGVGDIGVWFISIAEVASFLKGNLQPKEILEKSVEIAGHVNGQPAKKVAMCNIAYSPGVNKDDPQIDEVCKFIVRRAGCLE